MRKSMKDLVAEARSRVAVVSPADARSGMKQGDVILDVREPVELDSDGTVDGAVHVPRGLVEAQADADTGKANEALAAKRGGDGRVHVLCASGARAALAADSLRQMGYDTTIIEGGVAGWKEANLPLRV
ncbi:rhodanese-like domain-containing protein [Palleronia abyssalis]|uniref:Rhodanese domain-containing protein n=1 Tax=Palleronia abyssalis TaxID=1501240 RepID=A0A2R8BZV4_9RHOB|nr:rhodanese-like domain-containing protein [Palleronia abyssalis]SPJ25639.1 hypothetical protein PAA8504_03490 [Palleronia abyssalis]